MKLVKESLNESKTSAEFYDTEEEISARRAELKGEGYYIKSTRMTPGFVAKKDDLRIVVKLK